MNRLLKDFVLLVLILKLDESTSSVAEIEGEFSFCTPSLVHFEARDLTKLAKVVNETLFRNISGNPTKKYRFSNKLITSTYSLSI